MKTFHPLQRPSNLRVFTALLISFVILVTPVVPAAAGSPRYAVGFSPAPTVVTATKTDSWDDSATPDGKAEPGQTITYDVNVANTGAADATGVNFSDTIDPNTTLVPGSLRVSPLAFADSYSATINTPLSISAPGVLANDTGTPSPTAQPIAAGPTTQGGTVTLNADGSFTYTPPTGFQGADTFNYTATNGTTPNDTATVTINVDDGPAVTTTSPANGATGVAQNTNITVNFTEPVNATTSSFSVQCPTGTPQTFTLSASPAASFTLDPTADLPAGTTCTVTVFANQITDADTFDPPDQMAADYTFSFGVKPLAVDDMRSATGNVRINTAITGYSVLANDQAPGATITSFDAASANGGSVNVNTSTGTFTYDPPRGFTGTDSFNYTISNSSGSDTGTVVLTVTDTVWFINNAPGACASTCDGRLSHPYTSLAAFEADNGNGGSNPAAGDSIFIYTGSGSYTGPVTLENDQRVIGQGATSSLATLAGITLAPDSDSVPSTGGTAPSITSAGNGFNVVLNNRLYGLAFDDTVGTAVNSIANVGALIIGDVTVNNDGSNGAGIVLDDGGTSVTSTGTNTINTRSAVALSLTNSTGIGAANLTFRSISAGNNDANADPVNGIVLSDTGSAGGLVVTGAGAAGTGGTIQHAGIGISLTNTSGVSLSWMQLNDFADYAVRGSSVVNFTMANSVINGVNGDSAATHDGSVRFTELTGSASFTKTNISGGLEDNFNLSNTAGTLDRILFDEVTIGANSTAFGNDGVFIQADGTATVKVTVEDSFFTSARGDLFQLSIRTSGNNDLVFQRNALTNNHPNIVSGGGGFTVSSSSTAPKLTYLIDGNTFRDAAGGNLVVGEDGTTAAANFNGTISNNVIGDPGAAQRGSAQGGGIVVGSVLSGTNTVSILNNQVYDYTNNGITVQANGGAVNLTATIQGNTVAQPTGFGGFVFNGIRVNVGTTSGAAHKACITIGGTLASEKNTVTGSSGAAGVPEIRLFPRFNSKVAVPGFTPTGSTAADGPAMATFLQARNTATAGEINANNSSTNPYLGDCSLLAFAPSIAAGQRDEVAQAGTESAPAFNAQTRITTTGEGRVWSDMTKGSANEAASRADASLYGARIVRSFYERPATGRVSRSIGDSVKPAVGASGKTNVNAARARALFSGETVNANIGTLPAGKSVHITFQVVVDNPFMGALPQVSNTGTVSGDNFTTTNTNTAVTPILTPPSISIKDATVAEPASGSTPAAFAVTLSHSYTHTVTVDYMTASGGANPATAGSDYTTTSGTLTFNPGQTVQTISVPVLADADASETDETFFVNLSNATGGSSIADAQGLGTIKPEGTPGTVLISELRTSGPGGADDDFVELLNNTDSPITVAASDASAGWALVKSGATCGDTPVVIAVIPNGTVIPARGNYLLVGSAYSLGAYAAGDQTLVFNIENDSNVALFSTADLSNISTAGRLDAVGFGSNTGGNCDLLREGSTLAPASGSTSEYSFVRSVDKGATQDTNDNASDFIVVSTTASAVGSNATPKLGAPGPENSTGARGPVPCNVTSSAKFGRDRLDSAAALGAAPNTARSAVVVPNGANGTIDFRRTFTNNTGGNVSQLRFRITNVKDTSTPGTADLRALSSSDIVVTTSGGPVNVRGTTLEQPPVQTNGGSINSSLGVGAITLATPLAPGASVNLHLLFGVQTVGDYHLSFVVETATAGSIGQDVWELRGNTENGSASEGGCNTPPVANAGPDQTIECSGGLTPVTLDGTGSTDADGDTLTYEWREGATVLGTTAVLNTSLSFGSHTITLKVTDPSGDFSEDTVTINIVDTTDPMITAPPNVTVNTGPGASSCGAFVSNATLGTATASDGCSASVTVTRTGVPSGNNFPVGTTIVTYTANDGHGHTKQAFQSVTVIDNTPPTVTAPANIEVNAPPNSCSANVNPGTASASDNCPGVNVTGTRSDSQPLNAPYPVGTTTITWKATDASGNMATATQTVKVKDATPPTITVTTNTIMLSPPNHQYVTFSIAQLVASVSDGCDASVDINDVVISQVTSDEIENGNGDGNTSNDIVIAPDCKSLQLRSERQGPGDGRVYTITLKVKDSGGNVATAVRKIYVQKGNGMPVDSGVHYTVNGCTP